MEEYRVIRSARKTLSLEITEDLTVLVRAPYQVSQSRIEAFVAGQQDWITAHRERCRQWQEQHPEPTEEERLDCIARAKEILPQKVEYYGRLMGLMPTGLTITDARKRFGSCSGKNRIAFAWRLMRCPEKAIDYVVVHELAHIRHKNHGAAFYQLIASVLPDYKERIKLLKE